jgi:DNA-3-methyladenine glycosylase I
MSALALDYHDREWGVPCRDDRTLFEFLALSGIQAGLSWEIVLRKREAFRQAFTNFEPKSVARYNSKSLERLLRNPDIVRNRLKLAAVIHNARRVLEVQDEFGTFSAYLWQFVDDRPRINRWRRTSDCPTRTELSDRLSSDMTRRGFKFVGSTICYAYLQSVGLVNDHLVDCFRHAELAGDPRGRPRAPKATLRSTTSAPSRTSANIL